MKRGVNHGESCNARLFTQMDCQYECHSYSNN